MLLFNRIDTHYMNTNCNKEIIVKYNICIQHNRIKQDKTISSFRLFQWGISTKCPQSILI